MITLAQAQEQLAYWLEASRKQAEAQRAEISSPASARKLERADAMEKVEYWNRMCIRLERGSGISSQRIVILD